jgi:lipopolysaccharide transport system permease protein
LILLFVRRDIVSQYKQTLLGPIWFFIQPVFTTLVYLVVFGNIAKIPTEGVPPVLFYLSGIVTWNYFSTCFTATSNTFVANAGIFGKVYFPRLVTPVAIVISNLLKFAIQFTLFLVVLVALWVSGSAVQPGWYVLLTPLLLLMMASLGLGAGIIVSSLTTKYRDFTHLIAFGVQLLMYATPVIYPMSVVPESYQWIVKLNPMSSLIETFRFAYLGTGTLAWANIAYSGLMIGVVLLTGIVLFSRVEKSFMDTV